MFGRFEWFGIAVYAPAGGVSEIVACLGLWHPVGWDVVMMVLRMMAMCGCGGGGGIVVDGNVWHSGWVLFDGVPVPA